MYTAYIELTGFGEISNSNGSAPIDNIDKHINKCYCTIFSIPFKCYI